MQMDRATSSVFSLDSARHYRELSIETEARDGALSEGGLAHHGNHLPYSDGIENLRGWAGHGHQPGHDDVGIKDDAHDQRP